MADAYIGEIRIFAGNFAPKGWALCEGQLLPLAQNTALFSLLGTMYGGDGKTNFALPDLRGAAPMQQGQGPGLTERYQGESGGSSTVNLSKNEIPAHLHAPAAVAVSNVSSPANAVWAGLAQGRGVPPVYGTSAAQAMNQQAIGATGQSMPHNNMQPYLGVNFIIALNGIFPPRS
ncbi:tail fiber protein [Paenibacillus sp. LHD-38]|uniref:phage tail protein n=1 Tax=Paenibacillus sp. LHD-38 TaxID=3072143 RepID=UPI00280F2BDA|nr:tail fiber protein [Paenibacillus sp. LHD-38]MDQ8736051.1 tail fiber protein [Paenibacillus sp. LHD-38]